MKRLLLLAAGGGLVLNATAFPAGADQIRATAANAPGARTSTQAKPAGLVPPPPAIPMAIPRTGIRPAASATGVPVTLPPTDQTRILVVGTGGPFSLQGRGGNEQFTGTFSWRPDTPTDPLKLEVTANLTDRTAPRWNYIRVSIGNRLLATEKNFKKDISRDVFTLDLTGTVDTGVNQIVITGAGERGATAKWTLSSILNAKVISVDPDEVLVGDRVTIKGQNFPTDPSKILVNLGKSKQVPVKTATASELKFDVPKNLDPDEYQVTVSINNKKCPGSAKLIVRGIPRLTSTNLTGCPPGYPIVIFGKNFSKKLAENQVTVGPVAAEVQAGTTEQLTIICPSQGSNFYDGGHAPMAFQNYLQIKLKVGKIECKDSLPVTIGNSVWQDPGLLGGKEVPEVPVDVRNNF